MVQHWPLLSCCVFVRTGHIQVIDSFVSGAMEVLSLRPESIDEIGEANAKHAQLQGQKPEVHHPQTFPLLSLHITVDQHEVTF